MENEGFFSVTNTELTSMSQIYGAKADWLLPKTVLTN